MICLSALSTGYFALLFFKQQAACDEAGGVLVQSSRGRECIE